MTTQEQLEVERVVGKDFDKDDVPAILRKIDKAAEDRRVEEGEINN